MLNLVTAVAAAVLAVSPALPEKAPIPTPRPEPQAPKVEQRQGVCGDWRRIRDDSKKRFGATEVAGGIINDEFTVVTLVAPDGAFITWALKSSDGTACLMYGGTDWFSIASHAKGTDA